MRYVIVDTHPDSAGAELTHPAHVDSVYFKNFILPVYRAAAYRLAVGEELPDPSGHTVALRRLED